MERDYNSIVVGAGISGLLSALVLSKHGHRVLVIEKEQEVGGNCNSYEVDGFQVDTGVHAITHLCVGPLKMLMDNYFNYLPVFESYGHYYVRYKNRLVKFPSNLKEFARFDVFPKRDRVAISQSLTRSLTQFTFGSDLSKTPVYNAVPKTISKDCYEFIDTVSYFLSGKSMYETPVERVLMGSDFVCDSTIKEEIEQSLNHISEDSNNDKKDRNSLLPSNVDIPFQFNREGVPFLFGSLNLLDSISSLSKLATNNVNFCQGYPRGGLKSILNSVLYSFPDNVDIITGEEVSTIFTGNNVVEGVETANGNVYRSDVVVYTGMCRDLPRTIDNLPSRYKSKLENIKISKSLTIWLGLSQKMDELNYCGSEVWFKNKPYWAMPTSNYDSSFAPKGKQVVGFSFIMDEYSDTKSNIENAYKTIYNAIPGIENYVEMKHEQITIPEKAAITTNGNFADIKTPIKNLYLAGTDTDRRSMGITRAAYSVVELLKTLGDDGHLS
ncbi:NAD(P)/FAD-dependent oxidoreductase [Methanohalobium sp.]|uniref:phytoene desaturase family protein n=1 Tax=Methanohalobium sp. TaxID=2837493 RepID=UPI0025DF0F6B|nr:NAD(P)/FAD-dependent oxidoreductase [Methanohalobium sp.]